MEAVAYVYFIIIIIIIIIIIYCNTDQEKMKWIMVSFRNIPVAYNTYNVIPNTYIFMFQL